MTNKENEMIELTRVIVEEFLRTKESNVDLASRLHTSKSTIQRRLNDKKRIIIAFYPDGERVYELVQKNLKLNKKNDRIRGHIKSKYNSNSEVKHLNVDVFYKDEDRKYIFLKDIALTFRLKFDEMSDLFKIDKKEFNDKMLMYNDNCYFSFKYLNNIDDTNQELAKIEVTNFYKMLFNSKESNDIKMVRYLMSKIKDTGIKDIIKKYDNKYVTLTDEEIEKLIKLQIKYAYSQRELSSIIGINESIYCIRANKYLEENDELKNRYQLLSDYNYNRLQESLNDARGK